METHWDGVTNAVDQADQNSGLLNSSTIDLSDQLRFRLINGTQGESKPLMEVSVLVLAINTTWAEEIDRVLAMLAAFPVPFQHVQHPHQALRCLQDRQVIATRYRRPFGDLSGLFAPDVALASSCRLDNNSKNLIGEDEARIQSSKEQDAATPRDRNCSNIITPRETEPATTPAVHQGIDHPIHRNDRTNTLPGDIEVLKTSHLQQSQLLSELHSQNLQHIREAHQSVLWDHLSTIDPALSFFPPLTDDGPVFESSSRIGDYTIHELLGQGKTASVHACRRKAEPSSSCCSTQLAVKIIDKSKLVDLQSIQRLQQEIACLQDVRNRHDGLLTLLDVIHTKHKVYLITERGGEDLFEVLGKHPEPLSEKTIKAIVLHLTQALQVLHSNGYCHRDLKPENILYGAHDHSVKIVDFGLCHKLALQDQFLSGFCGSPGFFAPEMLLQSYYNPFKADVWSLGAILLELVLGSELFMAMWMTSYECQIVQDKPRYASRLRQNLSELKAFCFSSRFLFSTRLKHLLFQLLCEDPNQRLTVHEVLASPWLDAAPSPEKSSCIANVNAISGSGGRARSPSPSPSPSPSASPTRKKNPFTLEIDALTSSSTPSSAGNSPLHQRAAGSDDCKVMMTLPSLLPLKGTDKTTLCTGICNGASNANGTVNTVVGSTSRSSSPRNSISSCSSVAVVLTGSLTPPSISLARASSSPSRSPPKHHLVPSMAELSPSKLTVQGTGQRVVR